MEVGEKSEDCSIVEPIEKVEKVEEIIGEIERAIIRVYFFRAIK
jgi:hypothetical protein